MNEKPVSPLQRAAEEIEAQLKALGYTQMPLESRLPSQLQATFIPKKQIKPEGSEG